MGKKMTKPLLKTIFILFGVLFCFSCGANRKKPDPLSIVKVQVKDSINKRIENCRLMIKDFAFPPYIENNYELKNVRSAFNESFRKAVSQNSSCILTQQDPIYTFTGYMKNIEVKEEHSDSAHVLIALGATTLVGSAAGFAAYSIQDLEKSVALAAGISLITSTVLSQIAATFPKNIVVKFETRVGVFRNSDKRKIYEVEYKKEYTNSVSRFSPKKKTIEKSLSQFIGELIIDLNNKMSLVPLQRVNTEKPVKRNE